MQRFQANRDKIAKLLDERFCRMWEFYLIGSELTFSHRRPHESSRSSLPNHVKHLPLTRDYMAAVEANLPCWHQTNSADQIIFFGFDNPDLHHVAGLQMRGTGNEHIAVNFRRIPRRPRAIASSFSRSMSSTNTLISLPTLT